MSGPSFERARPRSRLVVSFVVASVLASALGLRGVQQPVAQAAEIPNRATPSAENAPAPATWNATGVEFIKTFTGSPINCTYNGGFFSVYFTKGSLTDCVRIDFLLSGGTGTPDPKVHLFGPSGTQFAVIDANASATRPGEWFATTPLDAAWPSGRITARVIVVGDTGPAGEGVFFINQLGAIVSANTPADGEYVPGEAIPLSGNIAQLNDLAGGTQRTGVPATFKIRLVDPDGTVLHTSAVLTASGAAGTQGNFTYTIPGAATTAVTAGPETEFKIGLGIHVIEAAYTDAASGQWVGAPAGSGEVMLVVPPQTLLLENAFVSSLGWVKPNETYPFRLFVRNFTNSARTNVKVTIPAPDGATFTKVTPLTGSGSAIISGGAITWHIGAMDAANGGIPDVATLVVQAKADSLVQDPEIVWKDLSATATLTYTGGPAAGLTDRAHGPKVIPPGGGYETARYGDKPFPMVPVDYRDRKHEDGHDGAELSRVVNSPANPGSTYNLYQEMSYGQLFPFGSVPSAGVASADFDYAPGFDFTERDLTKPTCRGASLGNQEALYETPAYPERISDGWYQLPGDTEYYGGDFPAFTLGTGSTIDGACGDTGKSVYDAAVIADPEINYNDFDFDKDGVVDFFMLVFVGLGGNGDSQINGTPPYDNIWPHSSSLEFSYQDSTTGLQGYISDDQLTDLIGTPQCWTNASYTVFDDCVANGGTGQNDKPVFVRVGPYNVNPESAMEAASVISHEFGHHLGLPDFYSTSYESYADWNLMASDYSQHMTIFGKQDLGWVVPNYLQPGQTVNVSDWEEIKNDTHSIAWQRPNGTPYTLSGSNVHNGQAYGLKLPRRQIIDPATVPSGTHLWYSGRGNDFGCTPLKGHNLDIKLDQLAGLAEGTPVTLNFQSSWDIEWDWDYGFTMVTTDGQDYTALPSANGYTTNSATNPNGIGCLSDHNNGLTGESGAYQAGPAAVAAARAPSSPTAYTHGAPFLEDEYDLTDYAGQEGVVLRFSYFTDPAFDRPAWFIDDLKISSGATTLYESDFETEDELRIFPGGCAADGRMTASKCTDAWSLITSDAGAPQDHAYYLELRDRSGFDFASRGQSDRGAISWAPGVLIEYTDEVRGYGNNGGGQPPRQHYLDSQPTPGADCGDGLTTPEVCGNAAFTAASGDKHFDDNPTGGADPGDWVDNFSDDSSTDGNWHFDYNCLSLDINSMSGTDSNESLPSNLTAGATITALAGCAPFSYTGAYPNAAPFAEAQARPTSGPVNSTFTFDGSGSSDDLTPANQLIYDWDFDNNGTYDATGQVVTRSFPTAGTKTVKLRVTDRSTPAKSSTDTVTVTVTSQPAGLADLRVTAQSYTPTTVRRGDVVTFRATVTNSGNAQAGPSSTTWFRTVSGQKRVLGTVATPAIPAGQSRQVQITFNTSDLKAGRYKITIRADWTNIIPESDGNNNTLSFNLTVQAAN